MGSYAESQQKDQRFVADSAEWLAAPESVVSLPYSIALGERANFRANIKQDYTPEVAGTVNAALSIAELANKEAMEFSTLALSSITDLSNSLQQQAADAPLGDTPVETKYLLYLAIGVVAFIIWVKK